MSWGDGSPDSVVAQATSPCTLPHAYAPGTWTATVTVSDGDGGSRQATRTVTVPASSWPWQGFFAPVDNAPVVNVVKAGAAVPVKFSLGGDRGLGIFAPGYPVSVAHPCGTSAPADDLEETATPGAATLTYDAASDRYHYNWRTEKSWAGTCRTLVLRFADGSQRSAEFRLTK